MGYYTDYNLTAHGATDEQRAEMNKIIIQEWGLEEWGDGWWCNAKWYDHDKDMLRLSLLYPNILFELQGDGEESDDMWVTWYKNGKKQHCPAEIIYPPFDESKLR